MPASAPVAVVAFLGDSLTAGYGVAPEEASPALVASLLGREGLPIRALNAGVSGDTTAGALRRVGWVLRQHPDVVVVALGANDGLRGLPVADTTSNLRAIVERCKAAGARVLLVGMLVPPSYGREYFDSFRALYPALAREQDVPLVPFLLEGVALVPELNTPDGIHPNAKGHERLAATILPALRKVVKALRKPR